MNEYNQEQIATEIAELLNSDRFLDALMGKTSGAQSGGSLVVRSNGRQVSAIAVGEVPPGDCVALRDTNTGQWYAVSSYDEGKNDDHLIRYRKWRQPDDDIVLPVKTIFAIYSNATRTTTFYLGGDRTSKKIDEVKNIRFDNAHIRNLGRNKFFAYSMYVDSADIFRLKINKDSTSNSVDYNYKWSVDNDYKWGKDNLLNIYTGINLDTTSYQLINDNEEFPARNIYSKDQEIEVRNLTLMTETKIKREDGSVLATDYSCEIETVRNNGDISITTFEIKTTLISSEKLTPFRSLDHTSSIHEVSSYLTSFEIWTPIKMGEKDVTILVAVNRIGEQKPYAYEYEETRNIASWKTGGWDRRLVDWKVLIGWTKYFFLVFGNPPDQEFGTDFLSFWDDEEDPVGNPPSVTGITSYISAMNSQHSTTPNSISQGSKTFTYPANSNNDWSVGITRLRAYNTANNTSYIEGLVTAVSNTSVTISSFPSKSVEFGGSSTGLNAGSGTFASWNITSTPNNPYDDLFSSPFEFGGQYSSLTLPNNQIIKNINFFARYIDYNKNKRKKDMDDSLTIPTSITEIIPNIYGYAPGTKITTNNQSITWNGNVFTKITNFHHRHNYLGIIGEPVFNYIDKTTTDTCVIDEGDPQYLDYIKKTCKVKGINTIFNCVNGEIVQDFEGDIEQYGGWQLGEKGTKAPYIDERTFKSVPNFYIKKEIKNEIKLIYDNKEITLNNGDFGLLDLKNDSTVVVSSINEETTAFTITYTNTALRLVKNINYADFTGDVFNGNFIMAWEIEEKPCLIKGTCTKSYNSQSQVLKISCTVENTKVNTPSSFPKTFIIDNGSYYAYCFRKNTNIYSKLWYSENSGSTQVDPTEISGVYFPRVSPQGEDCETLKDNSEDFSEILSKEIFNFIPLSHHLWAVLLDQVIFDDRKIICRIFGEYDNLNSHLNIHTTDNIIRNKIYSVAKTDKNKAWVEQWDILENGNVKYKKVFQVDYVPLEKPKQGEELTIFAHSYYPE